MPGLSRLFAALALAALLWPAAAAAQQLPPSENAPKVGQKAPDFTLPDADGNPVKLSALRKTAEGKGQWVLLVFYRGYW